MSYTIYALALPVQKPDWKDLKYIGMSKDIHYRFSQHLAGTDESQPEKREWIRSLREQGTTPVLCSLETVEDIEKAREREQFCIRYAIGQGAQLFNKAINYTPEERTQVHQERAERYAYISSLLAQGIYVKWAGGRYAGRLLDPFTYKGDMRLTTLRDYFFVTGEGKQVSLREASVQEFDAFISQYVEVENYGLDDWDGEDRVNAVNFALTYGHQLAMVHNPQIRPLKKRRSLKVIEEDEHPLEPVVPSGGRDYPDLSDEEPVSRRRAALTEE